MRIAVTYDNGDIFQHFGHTEQFKVYDVDNGVIVASQVVDTNGSGHGALAGVLSALNASYACQTGTVWQNRKINIKKKLISILTRSRR